MSTHRERGRTRAIVLTVRATWLEFRLFKSRRILMLDIEAAYQYAARVQATKDRAERAVEKKARKAK